MSMTAAWKAAIVIPWIGVIACTPIIAWWYLEPVPLVVTYVAPTFSRSYAYDRTDAEKYAVHDTLGGSTVYRYVEFCISKPFEGVSVREWVGEAIVWPAPLVPTASSAEIGCFKRSVPVLTPSSSPSRNFLYHQTILARTNPLRTDEIHYAPIPIRLLSPADFLGKKEE